MLVGEERPDLERALRLAGFLIAMGGFIFFYVESIGSFGHFPMYVPAIVVLAGICMILLAGWPEEKQIEKKPENYNYLSFIGEYIPINSIWFMLSAGILIILADLLYQYLGMVGSHEGMGDMDIIVIMLGLTVAAYPLIPENYDLERDFILTFFVFLTIMMVAIPFLFSLEGEAFTYYFLLVPLHKVLLMLGIENIIIPPSTLKITDPMSMIKSDIIIARSCSGVYSFSIFVAASISFILVIYRKINAKSLLFIALAIILAYIGNVLRMTIVTLSGYYYGPDTMSWVHEVIGYPIFFAWMAFFWFLLYRFLIREKESG